MRSAASRRVWLAVRILLLGSLLLYATYQGVALVAAAPSLQIDHMVVRGHERLAAGEVLALVEGLRGQNILAVDRKSTRLNSSHLVISYAVFCLKKKKKK